MVIREVLVDIERLKEREDRLPLLSIKKGSKNYSALFAASIASA